MKFSKVILAALVAATPFAANAASFNFTFTGEISSFSLLGGATSSGNLEIGDAVSGSFSYDGSIVPAGRLVEPDTITNFNVSIGGFSYSGTQMGRIILDNDFTAGPGAPQSDRFTAEVGPDSGTGPITGPDQAGIGPTRLQFSLGTALNLSIFEAGVLPTLADFQQLIADNTANGNTNFISFAEDHGTTSARIVARYDLTSVSVSEAGPHLDPIAPVPIPAALPLIATFLGVMGIVGRRRTH